MIERSCGGLKLRLIEATLEQSREHTAQAAKTGADRVVQRLLSQMMA